MDAGELPSEAVIREAKEETRLDVVIERLFIVAVTPDNLLGFLFYCRVIGGETIKTEESDAVCFFEMDRLPEHLPPRKREMIQFSADKPSGITYRQVNLPSGRQGLAELLKQNIQDKKDS